MPARLDPKVAAADMFAAGLEPLDPYVNVDTPWRARCLTCDHEVSPRLANIRKGTGGCRYCAGQGPVDPAVAVAEMLAAGLEPLEPFVNTSTPWRARCLTCNHEVCPRLNTIRRGSGCRYCAGRAPLDPEVAVADMRAAGLEPLEPYTNVDAPWRSRCLICNNEVFPRLDSIHSGSRGCMYCAGNAPLDPEVAAADMRAAGLEPLEPYTNVDAPWRSRCLTCINEVSPSLGNIQRGQGACRFCARYGFKSDEPGHLYLIRHDGFGALKIGITNNLAERVETHESEDWKPVRVWSFGTGAVAEEIEDLVLDAWNGYGPAVGPEDMPQGGFTETVSLDHVSEDEAVAFIATTIARGSSS